MLVDMPSSPSQIFSNTQEGRKHVPFHFATQVRTYAKSLCGSLGFEPILFEKGDIPFTHELPLDESCYREVADVDLFVLIIGGRYGSRASIDNDRSADPNTYDSITKMEFRKAIEHNVPAYIFIETAVYVEYKTFLRNKTNQTIEYEHVDSPNVFHFIEEILNLKRNNPVYPFERFSDIENILRKQWSGLFRELLTQRSQQQQIGNLSSQIKELQEASDTLKKYLEEIVKKTTPESGIALIESEDNRLKKAKQTHSLRYVPFIEKLVNLGSDIQVIRKALEDATSIDNFIELHNRSSKNFKMHPPYWMDYAPLRDGFNEARAKLDLPPLDLAPK